MGDGLDGGDGFTGVHLPQTQQGAHVKYTQLFICQSHLKKK